MRNKEIENIINLLYKYGGNKSALSEDTKKLQLYIEALEEYILDHIDLGEGTEEYLDNNLFKGKK